MSLCLAAVNPSESQEDHWDRLRQQIMRLDVATLICLRVELSQLPELQEKAAKKREKVKAQRAGAPRRQSEGDRRRPARDGISLSEREKDASLRRARDESKSLLEFREEHRAATGSLPTCRDLRVLAARRFINGETEAARRRQVEVLRADMGRICVQLQLGAQESADLQSAFVKAAVERQKRSPGAWGRLRQQLGQLDTDTLKDLKGELSGLRQEADVAEQELSL